MKKVLGLLAVVPAMELQSSTQVFSRIGMAESGGGSRTVVSARTDICVIRCQTEELT